MLGQQWAIRQDCIALGSDQFDLVPNTGHALVQESPLATCSIEGDLIYMEDKEKYLYTYIQQKHHIYTLTFWGGNKRYTKQ